MAPAKNTDYSFTITNLGDAIQEEDSDDDMIYNDGTGEIKYTDHANLKPIPLPKNYLELYKDLPPLPADIPVMIPPQCPAPPKDYKQKLKQEAAEYFKLTLGLKK